MALAAAINFVLIISVLRFKKATGILESSLGVVPRTFLARVENCGINVGEGGRGASGRLLSRCVLPESPKQRVALDEAQC